MKDCHRQECVSDRAECAHSKDYLSSGGPNTGHFRNLNTEAALGSGLPTKTGGRKTVMQDRWVFARMLAAREEHYGEEEN